MSRGTAVTGQLFLLALIIGCTSTDDGTQVDTGGAGQAGMSPICAGSELGGAAGTRGEAATEAGAAGAAISDSGAAGADAGAAGTNAHASRCSLFNGVDFSGWDRYLGKPSHDPKADELPLGIDNDPRGVYSIVMVDGEPAIRISGEIWGSLISQREFCNFKLHAQFKWGSAVFSIKDSGIMFLSSGPLGAVNAGGNELANPIGSAAFMVSAEYQISPNDVGSLYNLGPIAFAQSVHDVRPESKSWNEVEISLQDDQASLLLNGHEVSRGSSFVLDLPDQPPSALRCGKLQLQSEGAEIFFRHLEIEELP